MANMYFMITNNCNLECAHCFRDSGPRKKDTTISYDNFKKVIDNIGRMNWIELTGGEIFTEKDKLYGFLKYLQKINREHKSKYGEMFEVEVQTNAFWATSEAKIEKTLRELDNLGVYKLDITSKDEYHYAQGIREENLDELWVSFKKRNNSFQNLKHIYTRGAGKVIMPVGRGKNIWTGEEILNFRDCKGNISRNSLSVNEKGEVLGCCFGAFPLKGNLIEQTLEKIVENSLAIPRLKALDERGISEVAIQDGWDKENVRMQINKHGECGFCYEHYIKTGRDKSITNENQ